MDPIDDVGDFAKGRFPPDMVEQALRVFAARAAQYAAGTPVVVALAVPKSPLADGTALLRRTKIRGADEFVLTVDGVECEWRLRCFDGDIRPQVTTLCGYLVRLAECDDSPLLD